MEFYVEWHEDSSATVLARITARNGSGAATGVDGEGKWLEQADISEIIWSVFDLDEDADTPVTNEALDAADVVLDTPVETNEIWTADDVGYNFLHDIGPGHFPDGSHEYRIEYKVTTVGGFVFHGAFSGPAHPITRS